MQSESRPVFIASSVMHVHQYHDVFVSLGRDEKGERSDTIKGKTTQVI